MFCLIKVHFPIYRTRAKRESTVVGRLEAREGDWAAAAHLEKTVRLAHDSGVAQPLERGREGGKDVASWPPAPLHGLTDIRLFCAELQDQI